MILWLSCAAAVIVCIYGFAALLDQGQKREQAIRVVAGTLTSYAVVHFLLKL